MNSVEKAIESLQALSEDELIMFKHDHPELVLKLLSLLRGEDTLLNTLREIVHPPEDNPAFSDHATMNVLFEVQEAIYGRRK